MSPSSADRTRTAPLQETTCKPACHPVGSRPTPIRASSRAGVMNHQTEPRTSADTHPTDAAGHSTSAIPVHEATLGEMLSQLGRQLRAARTSLIAAQDPYGTTFPGQSSNWENDDPVRKQNAQYWKDLKASMTLEQLADVAGNDVQAIRDRLGGIAVVITAIETNRWVAKRAKGKAAIYAGIADIVVQALGWLVLPAEALSKLNAWLEQVERVQGNDAELAVAKYKFAEFAVALGLVSATAMAAVRSPSAGRQRNGSGPPMVQVPTPSWQKLVPDWRRWLPRPVTVVAGGPGGEAAIDGWLGPHFHDASAPEGAAQVPAPAVTTVTSGPSLSPPKNYDETIEQYLRECDGSTPGRAQLLSRLGPLLRNEVGISEALWTRLADLHPAKLAELLQTEGFLKCASSADPKLRHYVERLADRRTSAMLSNKTFTLLVRTAEGLMNLPEATNLEPVHVGGQNARHFRAVVNGQQVFLKLPRDPNYPHIIEHDLQAASDMMALEKGVRWYQLVRVADPVMGWLEGVAMEPLKGRSLANLSDTMTDGNELPFPITSRHVREVRAFQEEARIKGLRVDAEHSGNLMADEDPERAIVAVDMTYRKGRYSVPERALDPMVKVSELAEYSGLRAMGDKQSAAAVAPTPAKMLAAKGKLLPLLSGNQPAQAHERTVLVREIQHVLTELGVDKSICTLLVPQLHVAQLRVLFESNGLLEQLVSPIESRRLHAEGLAWEYGAGRLSRGAFEEHLSNAQLVMSLPPILGLETCDTPPYYQGILNGEAVRVKFPPEHQDFMIEQYMDEVRDKTPILARALHPKTRIWQRVVASHDPR